MTGKAKVAASMTAMTCAPTATNRPAAGPSMMLDSP